MQIPLRRAFRAGAIGALAFWGGPARGALAAPDPETPAHESMVREEVARLPRFELAGLVAYNGVVHAAGREQAALIWQVLRIERGSVPRPVWTGPGPVTGMVSYGSTLFWSTTNAVWRLGTDDGLPMLVRKGAQLTGSVRVSTTGPYVDLVCGRRKEAPEHCLLALASARESRDRVLLRHDGSLGALTYGGGKSVIAYSSGTFRQIVFRSNESRYVGFEPDGADVTSLWVEYGVSGEGAPWGPLSPPGHLLVWSTNTGVIRRLWYEARLDPETLLRNARLLAVRLGVAITVDEKGALDAFIPGFAAPRHLAQTAGFVQVVTFDEPDDARLYWAEKVPGAVKVVRGIRMATQPRASREAVAEAILKPNAETPPSASAPQVRASAEGSLVFRHPGSITALSGHPGDLLVAELEGPRRGRLSRYSGGAQGSLVPIPGTAGPRINGVLVGKAGITWWTEGTVVRLSPGARQPRVLMQGLIARVAVEDDGTTFVATHGQTARLYRLRSAGGAARGLTLPLGALPDTFVSDGISLFVASDLAVVSSQPVAGGAWRFVANDPTYVNRVRKGVGEVHEPWPMDGLFRAADQMVWTSGQIVRHQRLSGGPVRELPTRFATRAVCGGELLAAGSDGSVVAHPLDGRPPHVIAAPPTETRGGWLTALDVAAGKLVWAVAVGTTTDVYEIALKCADQRPPQ